MILAIINPIPCGIGTEHHLRFYFAANSLYFLLIYASLGQPFNISLLKFFVKLGIEKFIADQLPVILRFSNRASSISLFASISSLVKPSKNIVSFSFTMAVGG